MLPLKHADLFGAVACCLEMLVLGYSVPDSLFYKMLRVDDARSASVTLEMISEVLLPCFCKSFLHVRSFLHRTLCTGYDDYNRGGSYSGSGGGGGYDRY